MSPSDRWAKKPPGVCFPCSMIPTLLLSRSRFPCSLFSVNPAGQRKRRKEIATSIVSLQYRVIWITSGGYHHENSLTGQRHTFAARLYPASCHGTGCACHHHHLNLGRRGRSRRITVDSG